MSRSPVSLPNLYLPWQLYVLVASLCLPVGCEPGTSMGQRIDAGVDSKAPVPDSFRLVDSGPPTPDSFVQSCEEGWCRIAAGSFTMGSPAAEGCRGDDERAHTVKLTNYYLIAQREVTRGAFEQLMGKENVPALDWGQHWAKHICKKECYQQADREACSADCPITRINWHRAAAYCNQLSLKELAKSCEICVGSGSNRICRAADPSLCQCYQCTGSGDRLRCVPAPYYAGTSIYGCPGYRLPTEAEWERAYRAGTQTALYNGDLSTCEAKDDPNAIAIAWYKQNAYENIGPNLYHSLHLGGQKEANGFSIYDLAGNLSEWTHSWYKNYPDAQEVTNPNPMNEGSALTQRVMRGGHYDSLGGDLRAAGRKGTLPDKVDDHFGFRCARTLFH